MKKILIILLILTMMLTVTSCSLNSLVNSLTGGALSVGENLKWPKDKMSSIPELKGGKIYSVLKIDEGTGLYFSELSNKDAEAYYKKLKDACKDFSVIGTDEEGNIWFTGYINNVEVAFWCLGGSGFIISAPKEYEKYDSQIYYGDEAKWDTSKFGNLKNIPELKGVTVTSMSVYEDSVYITFKKTDMKSVKQYVEKIKSAGFTENYTYADDDWFSFDGYKGDYTVSVSYSSDGDYGTVSISR